jgi:hypothetical protein
MLGEVTTHQSSGSRPVEAKLVTPVSDMTSWVRTRSGSRAHTLASVALHAAVEQISLGREGNIVEDSQSSSRTNGWY